MGSGVGSPGRGWPGSGNWWPRRWTRDAGAFKHADQLADAIALKTRIETQLNQQSPQSASISTHLVAAEAALQRPANPPSTAPATYEQPAATARPAGMRIG